MAVSERVRWSTKMFCYR